MKQAVNDQIDILIGTQMISKGFNFPKLNCIVVVDADFRRDMIYELLKKIYNFIIN